MAEEPDRIRQDIETTRAALARDVDRLADRTSPTRVASRKWNDVKARVRSVSDRVMGPPSSAANTVQDKASDLGDTARDRASQVADAVRESPQTVARKTQGNPFAAGLIAFGAGLLAASLLPETDAERRAGREVRERAGDLIEPVKEKAEELRQDMSGSVRQATEQVKETARDAARHTTDQAKDSTREAAAETRDSARTAAI